MSLLNLNRQLLVKRRRSHNSRFSNIWTSFTSQPRTGLDKLPAWFLRLGAPIFARPICNLFNTSLNKSIVPSQWKQALIKPIPKVKTPSTCSDFRPISITPVLSRVMEKIVVRELIYPAIQIPNPHLDFSDQFAFRPTGSTTAAIITILQTITALLLSNSYVLVYALDFSKAFDTVRHQTLLEKFALLDLPDKLYNWLVNYFDGRSHCTQFEDAISMLEEITASIIQGSSLGLAAYIVDASDLKTVHPENKIPKFADDTYLIVGSSHECRRAWKRGKLGKKEQPPPQPLEICGNGFHKPTIKNQSHSSSAPFGDT